MANFKDIHFGTRKGIWIEPQIGLSKRYCDIIFGKRVFSSDVATVSCGSSSRNSNISARSILLHR